MAAGIQPEAIATQGGVVRHGPYPELTWQAVLAGYLLGSPILGLSIEGPELAAVRGRGVPRGVMERKRSDRNCRCMGDSGFEPESPLLRPLNQPRRSR